MEHRLKTNHMQQWQGIHTNIHYNDSVTFVIQLQNTKVPEIFQIQQAELSDATYIHVSIGSQSTRMPENCNMHTL
jgi:hypothetical protein